MPFKYLYILLLIIPLSCAKKPVVSSNPRTFGSNTTDHKIEEPKIFTVGKEGLSKKELVVSLENNLALDSSSNTEIISELIQRKLFVAEAKSRGMDTTQNFKEQIVSNVQLALSNILEDKKTITALGNEAYERYLTEVNAAHIFIPLSLYATPEDSLKIYNEILNIRELAIKNNDFATQAKRWSKDPETANKGGELGWFTVFKLIYPLESAVYATPKGNISLPIRTNLGYFIFKVNDTRKNSGIVKVQHIFKAINKTTSANEINTLYNQLDSIKTEIEKGNTSFEEMVLKFSDDFNSRELGGELAPFGVGRTESIFEEASFNLKKGEISKPVQSTTGLHLIRLIEKYKPEDKTKFLEQNLNKLTTDSRGEYITQKRVGLLKKQYDLKLNEDVINNALNFASVRILVRNWIMPSTVIVNDILFTIKDKNYSVKDFYDYVEERQEFEKWPSENPKEIFKMLFKKYIDAQLINFQEAEIIEKNPDVQRWINAQKENILYTEFVNLNIIEKSLSDTLGQKRIFENNRNLFKPKEEGEISVLSFNNEENYEKFKKITAEPKPYRLYRGITPILYTKNNIVLSLQDERKLQGLIEFLYNNPGYLVEIAGHSDSKEESDISELRIKEVVKFLVKNGVPLTKILEVNYKDAMPVDRFDWSKNQAVRFQFFSNLEKDLELTFNSAEKDAMVSSTFKINKKDFESKMKTPWGNTTGVIRLEGRIEEYTLKIKESKGTYKDYRGKVINLYQKQLKEDLAKKLASKFQLKYDNAELNGIINDLKRTN